MVKLNSKSLIDPRGVREKNVIEMAKRSSIEELITGKILFYNNTKLDFANYYQIFITLKQEFKKRGFVNIVEYKETVRGKTTADFKIMAEEFAKENYNAAVVALGDCGTSPATAILSIELEKAGIPIVYITAPPGSKLVEAVVALRVGRLCLCPLDIYQASTKEEIVEQVMGKMDLIIKSITLPPGKIEKLAQVNVDLDSGKINGNLELNKFIEVDGEVEPGIFMEETMELFDSLHLGDGLPFIPPTSKRIKSMYKFCPFDPDTVLAQSIGPSGKDIKINDIVVAAVMAGCKPEYIPILVTAFKALSNKKYNFLQSVTTSHPGGNLVLVSGPIANELGIYGGQGCLGPGFRANATIGRAVNLILINTCRSVPGIADLDCLASQAEYSYCFAEDKKITPWQTINEDYFDSETTTVYVLKAEPPHDVIEFCQTTADGLMKSFIDSATTLGSNNICIPGPLVIVLTPDHAKLFARDGWTKQAIKNYIHETVRWPKEKVENRGLIPVRPDGFEKLNEIPVTRYAEDVQVVVAGGRGGHSAVILPWALHSEGIIEAVRLPDGSIAKSINDFQCN